ncbi:MAG: methyltransferase domain-containing protein [Acidimicrobiia bacterium]|nr:methyltransferase domain-containing protein [Acidimicrobiia bacterium]
MSESERQAWDERYRTGTYQPRPKAGPFLESWMPRLPVGRTLDVACGAGRNAFRLAEAGHRVTAVDVSSVAVDMARAEADQRSLEIDWMVSDLDEYAVPESSFDLITVIRYVNRGLWPRLIEGLVPDGWLLIEHHLQTDADVDGPSSPDFRLRPQELLEAFAELRIVFYEETLEPGDQDGRPFALARLVACRGDPGF